MGQKLLSTQKLYGVDPKTLANMLYKDALVLMRVGLWKRKKELAMAIYEATDGDVASELQDALRKVMKAIDLTDLRLDEIKG